MIQEEQNEARNDSHIQTLMNMGLTLLQATIYLALAKLGKAETQRIAQASNVARPEVYRVMPALLKLGLAEKIIGKTTLYEATPIKEGLSILLQNRKDEYAELEKEAGSFLNSFHNNDLKGFQVKTQEFKVTSEWRLLMKMHKRLIQSAQASIDISVPWRAALPILLDWPCKKKLKIRLITQKTGKTAQLRKVQALAKNRGVEIKYLSKSAPFGMHVFDEKEVTLCLDEKQGLPSLWSNNPNIVRLAEAYFECLWNSQCTK
jgi:sugar-specific transcriptional regulator TrmB